MIAVEVIVALILLLLATTTTWMAIVGLMGAIGAVRMRRCRSCGHLMPIGQSRTSGVCPLCRHPRLGHYVGPAHLSHFLPQEMAPAEAAPLGAPKAAAH